MADRTSPRRAREGTDLTDARAEDWLVGGGEMGKLLRSMDWSKTPLGPIESWPQSLRTTVSLCLASNFPISLAWGPHHTQIYNDGYWPICGGKHPHSMGQDFTECWASAWPVIGDAFERACAGETSYLENQRMFLDRNGYLEETFFTFSFSPIRDESGGVGGLFHPVTETTSKMIGERRTRALRDLGARAGKAKASTEALTLAAVSLAEFELDLPFTLFFLIDDDGLHARLSASNGVSAGRMVAPECVELSEDAASSSPWAELIRSVVRSHESREVEDLEARFGGLLCGPYPEPPKRALALPITAAGVRQPAAVVVAGVSSRLPLNEAYRAFYDLLAAGITAALANARAYEEERKRTEALAEIDRAKTAFFSNVSHEFRTPLTLMLGPLEDELAEQTAPLPAARRERLETAHRNTLRLLKLVNTLLDFSRLEAGRVQASCEPVDLAARTADLASMFRSAIERAGLRLTVDCPQLPEPIYVDSEMWEKIVLNLLSNALKHTFEGGIHVALRMLEQEVELTVEDSGVGIPEAELPRLFERFHRVKGAKSRSHEGTGIGLALIQELVGLHGGSVRVESEPGKGSRFWVTLRRGREHLPSERVAKERSLASTAARADVYVQEALHWLSGVPANDIVQVEGEAASSARVSAAASAERKQRILWVDDNADMRDYVRRLLHDHYDVVVAADGKAALAAALEEPPDLVLSDVMMPGLDGFGLLRELRESHRTRTVPVILLSARAGEEAAVEGIEAGADDYLVKPFSARELMARVRTHLGLARLRRDWGQELERANEELEAFSYSVSHDLRAPLRAIDGFSKALLDQHAEQLDAEGKSYLGRVRNAAGRMSCLIDDLLALSRITRAPLHRQSVALTRAAHEVIDELRRRQPQRDVVCEVDDGLLAQADAGLVLVALENLLGNAWKFTEKRPQAQIRVGRLSVKGRDTFFVRDNGAGFDMTYAGRLFQPFQRLHARTEFEGTGIGLAIVRRIVSRHGGRVWAESSVEQGATFFFTLAEDR